MLDKVFAAIGLLGVIAFVGVVPVYVMEPDLWIVTIVIVAVAIIYIVRDVRASRSHVDGESGSDDSEG